MVSDDDFLPLRKKRRGKKGERVASVAHRASRIPGIAINSGKLECSFIDSAFNLVWQVTVWSTMRLSFQRLLIDIANAIYLEEGDLVLCSRGE